MTASPLIFFGAGAFGVPSLAHFVQAGRVLAIVTQPDKPAGRGGELTPTPIAQWAQQHAPHVPLLKPQKCNAIEVREQIRSFASTTFVVIAFGQKLGQALLHDRFAINLHASLLPRWRGAAPINAAMVAGDRITGNSVITLADRMDAGLVLATSAREIDPLTTAGELHNLLSADGPALLQRVLDMHDAGAVQGTTALQGTTQDESLVTIAPKMSKADGWFDCSHTAQRVRERVHGLTPWPGVSALLEAQRTDDASPREPLAQLKLLRVRDVEAVHTAQPGELLHAPSGLFACASNTALKLLTVQPPGKKPMDWAAFVNGRPAVFAAGKLVLRSEQPLPSALASQGGAA